MSDSNQVDTKPNIWTYYPVVFATALFCCILWGSATPAIKLAYEMFQIGPEDTASRILLAGARFITAGIMIILFDSLLERRFLKPKRSSWKGILIISLVQTVMQYYFFFMALAHTSGVRGSIINAAGNFLSILFAVFLFRLEGASWKKFLGCIVGFAGIILILGGDSSLLDFQSLTLAGEGAMFMAAVFYGLSSCCIKIFSRTENPVMLSGYQFLLGGIILFFIGNGMGGKLVFYSSSCIWNLLYMGFISAGAYTFWGILLKHNPVSRISILGFMNPCMGVLLSAIFLGENKEAFSSMGLISLLLVSLGIIIVNVDLKSLGKKA